MNRSLSLLVALALPACADTGTESVDVPLLVRGTAPETLVVGDWEVELESARLAFGPLYLCTGTTAGELCDTALVEWLDSAPVDLLDPGGQRVGTLEGSSGTARSWMYDLGITSLYTEPEPVPLDAADILDGNSVVLVGLAERGGDSIRFRAALPLHQSDDTEAGIPLVRKSQSDEAFAHAIEADAPEALVIRFDASLWVDAIDFDVLLPPTVAGPVKSVPTVEIQADTQPYRAVRNAVLSGERPSFSWMPLP